MKKLSVLACLVLLGGRPAAAADDNPDAKFDAKRLLRELPGTWESVSHTDLPREIHFIKHVTPTHFTWVLYDDDKKAVLDVTGGSWALKDGKYEETIEFASDNVQQLRGKTFRFTINLVGDKWDHKAVPDSEIEVDEVWTRVKQQDHQKKNTGEPGRQLLAAWDRVFEPGTPKAARTIKYITPTHWTWVAYDRDNRRVLAVGGGLWSLRDGEYVEDCGFATENIPQIRGGSFPYEFRVDGDRFIQKGGPNRGIREDETWIRLKRPKAEAPPAAPVTP